MKNLLPKKNKFGAKKVVIDGIKFDSIAEGDFYQLLKHQEKLGLVKILELQPKIYLTNARILYKPDFMIKRLEKNQTVYIDVKGFSTAIFNLKARLWKAYMDKPLEIIKRSGRNFKIDKIIEGKAS